MAAADDLDHLRQILKDLDYHGYVDEYSAQLVKELVSDLQSLSEHCNKLESGSTNPTRDNCEQTHVYEVVEAANQKISSLTLELARTRKENIELKRSTQKVRVL